MKDRGITLRSLLLGVLATAVFAWYTVVMENAQGGHRILTATQIPVLPYLLLIFCALALNPLLKRLRGIRPLSRTEVMVVFVMGMVSAGLSTFGLASQLVPLVSGLFNRNWNTEQARWDLYITPYVNEAYFISEPGIRAAAARARDAELEWRQACALRQGADWLLGARADRDRILRDRDAAQADADQARGAIALQRINHHLLVAERALKAAEAGWIKQGAGLDPAALAESLPARIDALHGVFLERRRALRALEAEAFRRVESFYKGLPDDLRAMPGLLAEPDERFEVYAQRLRRLAAGRGALRDLRAAEKALKQAGPAAAADALRPHLQRAAGRLRPLADAKELEQRKAGRVQQRREIEAGMAETIREANDVRRQRREASADRFDELDRRIAELETALADKREDIQKLDADLREAIDRRIAMAAETAGVLARLEALGALSAAPAAGDPDALASGLREARSALGALGVSARSMLVGDVPWGEWLGPLLRWAVLILASYVMLMAFNVLIFRQWAYNEKLIYPLAELPLLLGGVGDTSASGVPSIYRSGLFWAGVSVSAAVLGWNILATRQIIPGIHPIGLVFKWAPYIQGSLFGGLLPGAQHQVFFTLIGISFLVPERISRSLWSFHVLYMVLLLGLVWMGYGVNERSFPSDMGLVLNFRTAIGSAALMVFAGVTLWKCRRYLFCGFFPAAVSGLGPGERIELRASSLVFLASSALLVGLLTWGLGANLFFATFCYLVILMVTIGMVRAVAEGGLLVFQCWFTPFHLLRSTVGMNHAWTAPPLLTPLTIYFYVLFWDLKTFVAPAMANALKIRDACGMSRLKSHAGIFLALGVAAAVAVVTHVILGYHGGAKTMHTWFYQSAPRDALFGWIKAMAISNPVDTAGGLYWLLAGAAAMGLLLYFRQRSFWLPHPIGLVMWVNPVMWAFWFSILLGWIFKTLVSRYGDRDTYRQFRYFFIGLIVGELLMCLLGVDLNRN